MIFRFGTCQFFQERVFEKKSCPWLRARVPWARPMGPAHWAQGPYLPLFAAIRRYSPLFAAIFRYLPLFAAIFNDFDAICNYFNAILALFQHNFDAIFRYLPLFFTKIGSPKGLPNHNTCVILNRFKTIRN